MGEESKQKQKDKDFIDFTLNEDLLSKSQIILLFFIVYQHIGKEITDAVMESEKVEFLNRQKIECMLSKLF